MAEGVMGGYRKLTVNLVNGEKREFTLASRVGGYGRRWEYTIVNDVLTVIQGDSSATFPLCNVSSWEETR
jgi:hypothetical protein